MSVANRSVFTGLALTGIETSNDGGQLEVTRGSIPGTIAGNLGALYPFVGWLRFTNLMITHTVVGDMNVIERVD